MNIFFGTISLLLSTYLGFLLSKKYTDRKKFYLSFCEFNKILKNEISFSQKTIVEILKGRDGTDCFYKYLISYFINKKELNLNVEYISKEEKDFLNNYVKTIGNSDKKTQIEYIESISCYLDKKSNEVSIEEKKYKKTYLKLGFLIGLILLIILL